MSSRPCLDAALLLWASLLFCFHLSAAHWESPWRRALVAVLGQMMGGGGGGGGGEGLKREEAESDFAFLISRRPAGYQLWTTQPGLTGS